MHHIAINAPIIAPPKEGGEEGGEVHIDGRMATELAAKRLRVRQQCDIA